MTAIAGVMWRAESGKVPDAGTLLAAVPIPGHSATSVATSRRVSLGQVVREHRQLVRRSGPLPLDETLDALVGEIRLDNREDLVDQLRTRAFESHSRSDSELVLAAYQRWGERCVERLLGDFAFAIWDASHQRLFLARDHFGVAPLQYFVSDKLFVFASDARMILEQEGVPRRVHRDRVFDYFTDWNESADDTSTFFENVHRLQPGHAMTVTSSHVGIRRYWQVEEPEVLRLGSNGDYEEALRSVLGAAVRCRSSTGERVGLSLSGGIDSASIAVLMDKSSPARTYSAVSDEPGCIETELVAATNQRLGAFATSVRRDDVVDLCGSFYMVAPQLENPFDLSMTLVRLVASRAAQDGCDAVMTGMLADELLWRHPSDVMRQQFVGPRPWSALTTGFADGNLRNHYSRSRMTGFLASAALVDIGAGPLLERRAKRNWGRGLEWHIDQYHLLVDHDERLRFHARFANARAARLRSDGPGSATARQFAKNYPAAALERYHRTAAFSGVDARSPFMDKRVVEFFLGLPPEQLTDQGWTKISLRRALRAELPEAVVWNRTKPHLGSSFNEAWQQSDSRQYLLDLDDQHPLASFVDLAAVRQQMMADFGPPVGGAASLIGMARWLEGNYR